MPAAASLSPPRKRAATAALAASRLRSHSHGPGWTSSKSLMANTRLRSAEAKTPKLARCMSPQALTVRPVTGVVARSAAMTAAEPRRKAKGEASMRAKRTGTSFCTRLAFCRSRIATGSARSGFLAKRACAARGTLSRSALPAARRSSTEGRRAAKLSNTALSSLAARRCWRFPSSPDCRVEMLMVSALSGSSAPSLDDVGKRVPASFGRGMVVA